MNPRQSMVRALLVFVVVGLFASPALAQPAPAPPQGTPAPQGTTAPQVPLLTRILMNSKQWHWEQITPDHLKLTGQVAMDLGQSVSFFADDIDVYADRNMLVASGNVVFTNVEGRIAAEKVEFDIAANTGTFHQAFGLMSLGPKADRLQFANQEPDVYFYGDVIEKEGERRYRVTRGGFTTCVQPTPRWELVSGSVLLNLNDYALATNTVLKVKGVPLMYMPIIYYPIQDDDRATGFLLPTYGASTYRGHAISNAFFWAIDRSQDATFLYDWFSRAGQGVGGEYRYIAAPQSAGNFKVYRFNRSETTFVSGNSTQLLPASTSYSIVGTAVHAFNPRVRGRARVDYFSDVLSQQLLHQNIYQSSQRNRIIEGSLTAGFGPVSTTGVYQRNEVFNSTDNTVTYGSTPRITTSLAPQRLFNSPMYASLNTEYGFLPYEQAVANVRTDRGFSRYDLAPTLRVPLSRLSFLSVNASAGYRTTYYSRQFDNQSNRLMIDEPFVRTYATLRTDVVGPVFTRIFDLEEGAFADRLKHVIEPAFTVDTTSSIPDYQHTPFNSDISDFVVGGSTRMTYGITNRLFYRGNPVDGQRGQTREFVTVGIQQTYYSNPESSRSDTSYQSTLSSSNRLVELSPIALTARVSPSASFDGNARIEYDVSGGGLQVFSVGGSVNGALTSANVNFSRRHFDPRSNPDDFLSTSLRTQLLQRRMSATYSMAWDLGRGYIQSQGVVASYMAQCCGLQVEFQKYNYQGSSGILLPSDRRFNFGFVLAGLGTFSNFFGAFGGQQ